MDAGVRKIQPSAWGSVNGCWIKDNSFPSLGVINNGGWSKGGSVPIWGAISGT